MPLSARAPSDGADVIAKAPLTALIASHNEGHLLVNRLSELRFCDEIIVVDVASTDDTTTVAAAGGARIIPHPYEVIGENVRPNVVHEARHDLMVIPDPDEEIPRRLAEQIVTLTRELEPDVAIVVVPLIYYFGRSRLRGTIWGGVSKKRLVVRRSGVDFIPADHRGYRLRPGFRTAEIPYDDHNAIMHHWVSGYREFIRKHLHHVRIEGKARALTGEQFGFRMLPRTPWSAFRTCYFVRQGYRDGLRGFLLSVLYSAYRTGSDFQLIRELRSAPDGG
jgi:glycosyltransferase involved in cell wall biosynthesis